MNLYLLTQDYINDYDTYDSVVVAAPNEDEAKEMHPSGGLLSDHDDQWPSWAPDSSHVTVTYLGKGESLNGEPLTKRVILASFNAG